MASNKIVIFSDPNETSSSVIILNYFHIVYQSISSIEHLFLSFSSDFFNYELDFSIF